MELGHDEDEHTSFFFGMYFKARAGNKNTEYW
jgi:hypothetical protein